MMKTKPILLAFFGLALLVTPATFDSAFGQTTAFTYQGRLTLNGSSPSGGLDLTFKLFDDSTAGTQIGNALTNLNLSVSNGLVTVILDFGGGAFPALTAGSKLACAPMGVRTISPRLVRASH
jgi:hypothetical protein